MKVFNNWHALTGEHLHKIAHAASGYRKVLEENRKLYNQVQDLKGDMAVAETLNNWLFLMVL